MQLRSHSGCDPKSAAAESTESAETRDWANAKTINVRTDAASVHESVFRESHDGLSEHQQRRKMHQPRFGSYNKAQTIPKLAVSGRKVGKANRLGPWWCRGTDTALRTKMGAPKTRHHCPRTHTRPTGVHVFTNCGAAQTRQESALFLWEKGCLCFIAIWQQC